MSANSSDRSALQGRLAGLSPEKREILKNLLGRQDSMSPKIENFRPGSPADVSFEQERMWILDRLLPGSPLYNETTLMRFGRDVDAAVIEESLNVIIARHDALRTTFHTIDGRLVQVIAAELKITLPIVDMRHVAADRVRDESERVARESGRVLFDLSSGPLIRAALLRMPDECVLVVTLHHIVCDGWSTCILVRELAANERALATGTRPLWDELPAQYAQYAEWQKERFRRGLFDREFAYWTRQLADLHELQLPFDRPRPARPSVDGARHPVRVNNVLVTRLRAFAREQGVTVFATLLTAFKVLLLRYTDCEDIAVGIPMANRPVRELEPLIGFFANTIVVRTNLSGGMTFRQSLERVARMTFQAHDYQALPFDRLVEELAPERDLSRNPLFQVAFQLFSAPRWEGPETTLMAEVRQVDLGIAKVDLRLDLTDLGAFFEGYFEYNTALWHSEAITRMAEHYFVLLDAALSAPDTEVSRLPWVEAPERRQLLEWSSVGHQESRGCIHRLFELRAREMPEALAIAHENRHRTFASVDRQSNQLARYLKRLGVSRGSIVGVCAGRSAETVILFLGILKAGAAYLPLDPDYPRARLNLMLDDAAPFIVVASTRWRQTFADYRGRIVWLEDESALIAREGDDTVDAHTEPNDTAYVIYTSGSTGKPKAVLVEHSGAANVAAEQAHKLRIAPGDRVLQFAALGFDASIFEMLTLISGATLVIASRDQLLPGKPLARTLRSSRISVVTLPPSSLASLPIESLPDLRLINAAGEALPAALAADWRNGREFFNLYGPTETSIWATAAEIDDGEVPSIGKPIAGVRAYVLDAHMEPVPIGVAGELYIGGAGVARGYLHQPETTAIKFLPDPFCSQAGARLYATGDRVRYRPDGNLEFLGRVDDQLKIRGHRVEPAEVERALSQHPAVMDCAVVGQPDLSGDTRLAAYVVRRASRDSMDVTGSDAWDREQIRRWQRTDNSIYERDALADPTFNTGGWNSSYTGSPLKAEEMREQVEGTVERILSLKPERILEIGCGTGLVLFRVAPYCNQYCATDMSQFAIDYVARHLGNLAERVELRQALADDFSFVEPGSFDVVVLNSVVQYFPGARYLERVLNQALRALRKGGSIFVGDVRSFELSQAFYASVELSRAPSQATSGDIRQRAARRMREEAELLVSPGWFKRFSVDSEENVGAAFQLKRGRILNELTRFRYDVVLQTGIRGQLPDALEERQWNAVGSLQTLEEALRARPTSRLVVRSIPNARLDDPLSTLQWVETAPATASVRERLDRSHNLTRQSVDPEDLWRLARETGYVAQVVWAGGAQDGYIDVLFQPDSVEPNPVAPHWQRVDHARPEPWYINSPQENETAGRFVSTLREYLRDRLPEYLRPSFVVVLDALPLSANGKVDRRRLPAPRESLVMLEGRFVPPRTRLERLIAQVWQRVLGIETVGAHDNFFDLGGHSLLMVRAHEELCETWTEPLAITDLFRFPTVRSLAAFLDPQSAEQENSIVIEDRAGRQRSNMARRPPRSSSYETPNTKPGAADGNEPAVTQTKLHPVEVSRIKEAVAKWRSFRNV